MSAIDKRKILAAPDLPLEEVEVPEWGLTVHLRTFSVGEGIALEEAKKKHGDERVVGLYLAYALGDAEGRRLFDESDIDALYEKNPRVLVRLFNRAVAHNKMAEADDGEREGKS